MKCGSSREQRNILGLTSVPELKRNGKESKAKEIGAIIEMESYYSLLESIA